MTYINDIDKLFPVPRPKKQKSTKPVVNVVSVNKPTKKGFPDPTTLSPTMPGSKKKSLTMKIDQDIFDFFKSSGEGYTTKMNNVLRQFMDENKK